MTFSYANPYVNSRESQTSCIECRIPKKRWRDIEANEKNEKINHYYDYDDDNDDNDDNDSNHRDERKISPWTVCQFEFDEDYLSNGNEDRKSMCN